MQPRSLGMWLLASAGLLGCGSADEPNGPAQFTVVSGADVTDSANARLTDPLVVELRDQRGNPLRHQPVTFTGSGCAVSCATLLIPVDQPSDPGHASVVDTTDGAGRARARVAFGPRAGIAAVSVSSGTLTPTAAQYFVTPGQLVSLVVTPGDTGLFIAGTYRLQPTPSDANGNPVALGSLPTFTSLDPGLASVAQSGIVTGVDYGPARIEVGVGALRDTVSLTVVPRLTIAINNQGSAIMAMGLDGSNVRNWPAGAGVGLEALTWIPGQGRVVYSQNAGPQNVGRVMTADLISNAIRITTTDTLEAAECYPAVSADATQVYFSANGANGRFGIYRVGLNGAGLVQLPTMQDAWEPDITADNDRLVYSLFANPNCGVAVLTISTGIDVCVAPSGILPHWSPDGTRIAYIGTTYPGYPAGPLIVMNADGSGSTTVSPPQHNYVDAGVTWSSDGEWVLAVLDVTLRMELIRPRDGLTLPLTWLPKAFWSAIQP